MEMEKETPTNEIPMNESPSECEPDQEELKRKLNNYNDLKTEIPFPEGEKLSNILLKKFGQKSAEIVCDIVTGKITGFTIITAGPNGISERGVINPRDREKAFTEIALNDLEKKLANTSAQTKSWIDRILKEIMH